MITAILGSGSSLTREDVDYLKGKCKVIVVNDCYKLAPWADMLFGGDLKWWNWEKGTDFKGEKWTHDKEAADKYELNYIESRNDAGFSTDPNYVSEGCNSGFAATNLAYHQGATKILLLGFDMQYTNGKQHWFGEHPDNSQSFYELFMRYFRLAAKQNLVEIINCTRETALDCFPRMMITEAL